MVLLASLAYVFVRVAPSLSWVLVRTLWLLLDKLREECNLEGSFLFIESIMHIYSTTKIRGYLYICTICGFGPKSYQCPRTSG